MCLIPGGTFQMGSDRHYPEEAPVRHVRVTSFWMDRGPVTNRQFRRFIAATGYVTVAETAPDAKDYPGALPHTLKPGSLAFMPPRHCTARSFWDTASKPIYGWHRCECLTARVSSENDDQPRKVQVSCPLIRWRLRFTHVARQPKRQGAPSPIREVWR